MSRCWERKLHGKPLLPSQSFFVDLFFMPSTLFPFCRFFALAIHAQVTTGSLSGTVSDPAGAVVAGAKVDVTNQGTGVTTSVLTNDAGVYRAAFLIPGSYTVRVQAPGFRAFEAKNVGVELGREPSSTPRCRSDQSAIP